MNLIACCKPRRLRGFAKNFLIMKLTVVFMLALCLNATAKGFSQRVSLTANNTSLEKVFRQIRLQTGYTFVSTKELLQKARPVSINISNGSLKDVLDLCFKDQPFDYAIVNQTVVLVNKKEYHAAPEETPPPPPVVIKGKITNEKDEPLFHANITEKGTNNTTTTKEDGTFTMSVASQRAVLVVSYVGYNSKEFPLNNQGDVTISLTQASAALNDIVVVGYGTQRKVNLTGSVSSISAADIESRPITQASQALAGLASGVQVAQGSGQPGGDQSNITIRGMGTFSGAGNGPLVLVDGLASSINDVDPNNIKSISVLKDAASASIYGTRAANGVILIETKRGQNGRLQVGYDGYMGWQKPTELPDFVESWEYAQLRNEANVNMGQTRTYTDEEIGKFRNGSDPDKYPNVPHLKNLLTSGSGFQTNHNLSFTGGDGRNSYLFALGYLNQNGIVDKNDYSKYNFLLNFDSKIKSNLNLKVNLAGNAANTNEPRHYEGDMTNMILFAVREGPIFAGRKSDGTYGYQDNYSPEAWMSSQSFMNRKSKYFQGGAELAWEPIKGLTLSGKAGYNYNSYDQTTYSSNFVFDPFKTVGPNNLNVRSENNNLITLQSLLQYNKTFNDHKVTLLLGYSQEQFRDDWNSAYRDRFPNNSLYEINAGSSANMQAFGSAYEWALRSYFGRINYSYKDRYLFEANARYDGTSRFPSQGRWGLFPSFSAGWRISEEPFMKDNITWMNNLKLRASWGKLGNQNVGNYPYQNLLQLGQNYSFGGVLTPGARVATLANSNITWETTRVTNIGLDMDILGGKLGLVADYFDKATSGILYNISVSRVLGLNTSEVNAGAVKNTGFEVMLNYRTNIGQAKVSISPNFSYVKNNVTRLASGLKNDIGKGLFVGQPISSIYGYVADGLFVNADDIAKYPTQPYAAEPGFVRYKDISGPDGVPDGKVDPNYDRTIIGTTFPRYSYGATIGVDFKGFDFSLLLQGLGGWQKQIGAYQAFAFYNAGQVQRWQADNRWTTENPNPSAAYPKLTSLNMGSGTILTSTYWNRDATFLRAKNIQLGYSFSSRVLQRLRVTRLRLFFSGQNLFTLNRFYQGWDPEMNQSTGNNAPFYPITAVYTFGVNLKF